MRARRRSPPAACQNKQTGSQTSGCRELAGALVLALPRARAASPLSFASLNILARAGVPGAGGISAECLVEFEGASQNHRVCFRIAVCIEFLSWSERFLDWPPRAADRRRKRVLKDQLTILCSCAGFLVPGTHGGDNEWRQPRGHPPQQHLW